MNYCSTAEGSAAGVGCREQFRVQTEFLPIPTTIIRSICGSAEDKQLSS